MPEKTLYAFEDLSDDLPRAPLAGMRALLSAGVIISTKGWAALSRESRWAIVQQGLLPSIDNSVVQELLRAASVSELRLVPRMVDPHPTETPPDVLKTISAARRISNAEWAALRPIDRYVLHALTLNTRLFFRAVQEIFPVESVSPDTQRAVVAHCEVIMRPETLHRLKSPIFLDGRAFVLARVAGVRAARRAAETFDLRSEKTIGPIELDWAPGPEDGCILWQAHVSSWDGSFFAAASFAAATTAAIALCDMVSETDPSATLADARISEEPWQVGSEVARDDATAVFTGKQRQELREARANPHPPTGPSAPPTPRVPEAPISHSSLQPVMPPPHHAHRPAPAVIDLSRPSAASVLGISNATLIGIVLGLLVLLLVFVILILAVLWGRAG